MARAGSPSIGSQSVLANISRTASQPARSSNSLPSRLAQFNTLGASNIQHPASITIAVKWEFIDNHPGSLVAFPFNLPARSLSRSRSRQCRLCATGTPSLLASPALEFCLEAREAPFEAERTQVWQLAALARRSCSRQRSRDRASELASEGGGRAEQSRARGRVEHKARRACCAPSSLQTRARKLKLEASSGDAKLADVARAAQARRRQRKSGSRRPLCEPPGRACA